MAKYRVHKTKNYTVMSNGHFREKEMSLKAKGLLSLMLSLPDDWDYSISGLVTLSKDGKDSVMNALKEIEKFGYLQRTRTTDEKGQFSGYDYDIFEFPKTVKPKEENPYSENPNAENPPQLNTNQLRTKEISTNKQSTYKDIVDFLNSRAGTKFRSTGAETQKHINARLNEGFTIDEFKIVIDKKCAEWRGTSMEQYLRPSTLFGTKFESYLNAKINAPQNAGKETTETINGKEYVKKSGKYYLIGGSGVAVNPFANDEQLPF